MMNFSDYDFNSDAEIPLEVLRERYLGAGRSIKPNVPTVSKQKESVSKRILDALMLAVTIFIAVAAIFGIVEKPSGESVSSIDLIFFEDANLVKTIHDIFTYGFDDASLPSFISSVIQLFLGLSLAFSVVAFVIEAVFIVFTSTSRFIKKQSIGLERNLVHFMRSGMSVYLFAALSTYPGYDIIGAYVINPTLTIALVLGVLLIVIVAITRDIIRRRSGGKTDEFLKLHITSFVSNFAIFALISSAALCSHLHDTIIRAVEFLSFIPDSLSDGEYIVTTVIGVAFLVMGSILVSNLKKGLYRDGLRLITSGESLDAKTRSELLNEDFNKKPFKMNTIFAAVAFSVTYVKTGLLLVSETLALYRNMYLYIALISLAALILTEVFKRAKKN